MIYALFILSLFFGLSHGTLTPTTLTPTTLTPTQAPTLRYEGKNFYRVRVRDWSYQTYLNHTKPTKKTHTHPSFKLKTDDPSNGSQKKIHKTTYK